MTARQAKGLAVAVFLLLYFGGYAVCRRAGVLVHTANVLNVDFHGRYHMIHASRVRGPLGRATEVLYWPLREVEARWHGRGGRLA